MACVKLYLPLLAYFLLCYVSSLFASEPPQHSHDSDSESGLGSGSGSGSTNCNESGQNDGEFAIDWVYIVLHNKNGRCYLHGIQIGLSTPCLHIYTGIILGLS